MYPPVSRHGAGSARPTEYTTGARPPLAVAERGASGHIMREDVARYGSYEAEGSERRAFGSISITSDARWMATLTVPSHNDVVAFLCLERHGPLPANYRGIEERAHFSLPVGEIGVLIALLVGIEAQARRDSVLP